MCVHVCVCVCVCVCWDNNSTETTIEKVYMQALDMQTSYRAAKYKRCVLVFHIHTYITSIGLILVCI